MRNECFDFSCQVAFFLYASAVISYSKQTACRQIRGICVYTNSWLHQSGSLWFPLRAANTTLRRSVLAPRVEVRRTCTCGVGGGEPRWKWKHSNFLDTIWKTAKGKHMESTVIMAPHLKWEDGWLHRCAWQTDKPSGLSRFGTFPKALNENERC